MCDLRVAADTAWFSHPDPTFGDVVHAPLHDLVGGAVAREIEQAPQDVLVRLKANAVRRAGVATDAVTLEL
jgi:enoyl-CoA hydratase